MNCCVLISFFSVYGLRRSPLLELQPTLHYFRSTSTRNIPPPLATCCAITGHAHVVKLLVKANALVDKANQKGTTALMRATQEGNEEVVLILVAAGADVSKRNNERMNALMLGSQV